MNILEESKKTDQNRSTSNKITWANNCNYSIDCLVCKHQATSWFPARLVTVSTSLQDICRNGFKAGHVGAPWWYAELVLSFVLGKTHTKIHEHPMIVTYSDHHLATSRCILFGTEPHFSRLALLKTEITQFFPSDSCGPNVFAANAWLVYVCLCISIYIYVYLFTQ